MGAAPAQPPPDCNTTARANVRAALSLLAALQSRGLSHLVLCPGSRSAPLAVAASLLERQRGLQLHTAIDERSAAFFALGLARGQGRPAAVVTTSGTAVAQLLAAAVEADLGTIPLLLLSADRPARLKNCGANQAVPQERFLLGSCRLLLEGPPQGLADCCGSDLEQLASAAMDAACGNGCNEPAGPVHLNLPFEEPLHVDGADLEVLLAEWPAQEPTHSPSTPTSMATQLVHVDGDCPRLDPDRPGLVVAGPWRGSPAQWPEHCQALRRWQQRSGWPVLADPLSNLRGLADLELVHAYDPLLEAPAAELTVGQVLRLGSLPASRRLQRWLESIGGRQVLVSQGDPRRLDPLGTVAPQDQWSAGLASWLERQPGFDQAAGAAPAVAAVNRALAGAWRRHESLAQQQLERCLHDLGPDQRTGQGPDPASAPAVDSTTPGAQRGADASHATPPPGWSREVPQPAAGLADGDGELNEPWLARALSRLLPPGLPLMLASSSPVRDWECFADPRASWRPVHGFRGASGIDGTLSIACGLAEACGQLLLVSGDLALLHDANGWLWSRQLRGRLTVVLIENGGGGIFEQLPIRTGSGSGLDFERLFAMPQPVDQLALAALHGVPGRRVLRRDALQSDLDWALAQPFAVLEVRTRRQADALLRQQLRRAVAATEATVGRMVERDSLQP